jgi:arabinan endo-1,5-alpha-L-arabinosidase
VTAINGRYVMWYTTKHADSGRQCISVATAQSPMGPFVDQSSSPAICPLERGGAIDPSTFLDIDGSLHLLYKTDGNCCGLVTNIETVKLSSDGRRVESAPVTLLTSNDLQTRIIEAPSMSVRDGRYHLLFSVGDWQQPSYRTARALCDTAEGPCVVDNDHLLRSWTAGTGAGGAAYSSGATGSTVVFHAWDNTRPSYQSGGLRRTWIVSADALT